MRNAPTSVKVIAIIGIVLGSLGILGLIWSLITIFAPLGPPNPILEPLRHDSVYIASTIVALIIGVPLTVLLIVACVQSLRMQRWARRAMIVYAWLAIVQCVVGTVFNGAYLIPKMLSGIPAGTSPEMRAAMIGGAFGGACGGLLSVVFPVCILYFFSRKKVVDAFNGIFPVSPTDFPVEVPGMSPPPLP